MVQCFGGGCDVAGGDPTETFFRESANLVNAALLQEPASQDRFRLSHLQIAENEWDPAKKRSRLRILYNCSRADDLKQIRLVQLSWPNGALWRVTKPRPNARKRLSSSTKPLNQSTWNASSMLTSR